MKTNIVPPYAQPRCPTQRAKEAALADKYDTVTLAHTFLTLALREWRAREALRGHPAMTVAKGSELQDGSVTFVTVMPETSLSSWLTDHVAAGEDRARREPVVANVAFQIAELLAAAHDGPTTQLVHGDIRLSELWVQDTVPTDSPPCPVLPRVVVTDWTSSAPAWQHTFGVCGNPRLPPPEYYDPHSGIDSGGPAADVWGLGMIVLQCLALCSSRDASKKKNAAWWSRLAALSGDAEYASRGQLAALLRPAAGGSGRRAEWHGALGSALVEAGWSSACADFVEKCLSSDPAARPRAGALLGHAWLAAAHDRGAPPEGDDGPETDERPPQRQDAPPPPPRRRGHVCLKGVASGHSLASLDAALFLLDSLCGACPKLETEPGSLLLAEDMSLLLAGECNGESVAQGSVESLDGCAGADGGRASAMCRRILRASRNRLTRPGLPSRELTGFPPWALCTPIVSLAGGSANRRDSVPTSMLSNDQLCGVARWLEVVCGDDAAADAVALVRDAQASDGLGGGGRSPATP